MKTNYSKNSVNDSPLTTSNVYRFSFKEIFDYLDACQGNPLEITDDVLRLWFSEVWTELGEPQINGLVLKTRKLSFQNDILQDSCYYDYECRTVFLERKDLALHIKGRDNQGDIIKGLMAHELSHEIYFCSDLSTSIYITFKAEELFAPVDAVIKFAYVNFQATHCLLKDCEKKRYSSKVLTWTKSYISSFLSLWDKIPFTDFERLYWKRTMDIGDYPDLTLYPRKIRKMIRKAVRQMIGFRVVSSGDNELHGRLIEKFGKIILPFFQKPKRKSEPKKVPEHGLFDDMQEKAFLSVEPEFEKKIQQAAETFSPEEYIEWMKKMKEFHPEIGAEERNPDKFPDMTDYYSRKAKQLSLFTTPREQDMAQCGVKRSSITDFLPCHSPLHIDFRYSGRFILPGLTKVRTTGFIEPKRENFPKRRSPLLIYKDVSGSMPQPSQYLCPDIIAAAALVMGSLNNNWPVAVGQVHHELIPYYISKEQEKLVSLLCSPSGGGNAPLVPQFQKDIDCFSKESGVDDLIQAGSKICFVILTDGGIKGIESLLDFLKSEQRIVPVILHSGIFDIPLVGYDQKSSGFYEGIHVITGLKESEIVMEVLKVMQEER